jgi:hypothetical protein
MDSTDKLLQLLNETNDPLKTFTRINVGLVDVQSVEIDGPITKVTVTAVPGRGYSGSVDVQYHRLDLSEVIAGKTVRSLNAMTPQIVIDLINSSLGLFLSVDDLLPFTTPTPEEGTAVVIDIEAAPDSPGFMGLTQITVEYGRSWLDQVVGRRSLNELTHPISVDYRKSARMLTWGRDFTCVRDAIKPDKNGDYTNWDVLQKACAAMGIPSWDKWKIADYPTTAIPDANPAFHRVVIQTATYSGTMVGKIYLHYNVLEEV